MPSFYNAWILAYTDVNLQSTKSPLLCCQCTGTSCRLSFATRHDNGPVGMPLVCLQSTSHSDHTLSFVCFHISSPRRASFTANNEPLLLPFPQPHYLLSGFSLGLFGCRRVSGEKFPPHIPPGRLQLKCDGARWRTGRAVNGKLANGVSSQYPSHYLGTWCIQHYYRWYAKLGCQ